jgi:hypothetical protein
MWNTAAMGWLLPTGRVARRVGTGLGLVTAVILVGFVLAFGIHRLTPIPAWKEFLDVGGEGNLPTWWNSILLALVAVSAFVVAFFDMAAVPARKRAWWVVAAAAGYLSIDEAAVLHERLAGPVRSADIDLPTYAWLLPGTVLAVCGAGLLIVVGRRLPKPTAARLAVALATYGAASIVIEGIGGWIRRGSDDSVWFSVSLTLEEGTEMAACVYAVAVIVDSLQFRGIGDGTLVTTARDGR